MADEFKAITTQEELNQVIGDRLKRQKEAYETQIAELEEFKTKYENQNNELTSLKEVVEKHNEEITNRESSIEDLQGKLKQQEVENLRINVALKNGIPYSLANRLVGDDEEALTQDAKSLSQMLAPTKAQPLKDTEPQPNGADSAYRALAQSILKEN